MSINSERCCENFMMPMQITSKIKKFQIFENLSAHKKWFQQSMWWKGPFWC